MSRSMIVVTGGAGFIGSNMVARLSERGGADVVVVDRLRSADSGKWRNIAKHAPFDIWAPEVLFDRLEQHGGRVEAIVHMGAVSSTTEPDADHIIHSNFTLSRDLFDWCAVRDRRLVYASSAATYGAGDAGFDDDDDVGSLKTLRPLNAYGFSKSLFDIHAVTKAGRGEAPPQWAGLKFFNVYGPNEYHKGAMKSVVAQIWPKVAAGERVGLFRSHRPDYPDGGQLRDFVFVDDVIDIMLWLLDNPDVSGVFNAGSGAARSFEDLARATFAAAGQEPDIGFIDMPEAIRDRYQYFTEARMDRIRAAGWPGTSTTLEDGVRRYVQDFLAREDSYR